MTGLWSWSSLRSNPDFPHRVLLFCKSMCLKTFVGVNGGKWRSWEKKQETYSVTWVPAVKTILRFCRPVQSLSHVWLCDLMDCSMPSCPVHHQLPGLAQTYVHWVGDAMQPSHPLLSASPPVFNLPQPQGLFQRVGSSYQVAKVLELQLQHQSFQWIFRTDFL